MAERIDLTGQKFGRLTVIEQSEPAYTPNGTRRTMWKCKCDCGNIVTRSQQNLRSAKHASCGCWKVELTSERKLEDLTGQRFGRLVVLERAASDTISTRWKCQCDCGNTCVVIAQNLKRGHTQSCGCYREEKRPQNRYKHGYRKTKIYNNVYCKIKARCYNSNDSRYDAYGGRGIRMCEEWLNDPAAFCEWAYEHGYREDATYGECTIDRIDVNGNYEPSNCRIITNLEQQNNKRNSIKYEYNGETRTAAEWARIYGVSYDVMSRLLKSGKSLDCLKDGCTPRKRR